MVPCGLDNPDLDRHVEVADELLDDSDLLRILPAEPRDLRADEVEELEADGGDAAEVVGAVRALEPFRRATGLDPRRESAGIHLGGGRGEHDVNSMLCSERLIAVEVPRIRGRSVGSENCAGFTKTLATSTSHSGRAAANSAAWPS